MNSSVSNAANRAVLMVSARLFVEVNTIDPSAELPLSEGRLELELTRFSGQLITRFSGSFQGIDFQSQRMIYIRVMNAAVSGYTMLQ